MSKYRGLVLEGYSPRAPLGAVAPALSLPDVSRYRNNGGFTDVTWVQLPSGLWVMELNDATSGINCGSDPSHQIANPLTIIGWVYPNGADMIGYFISNLDLGTLFGYALWWDGFNDRVRLEWARGNGGLRYSSLVFSDTNVWVFVGCTVDAADLITFYRNGQPAGTSPNGAIAASPASLYIGRPVPPSVGSWNGYIAPPRVYNYALSGDEINKHFEAERRLFGM